MNFTDEEKFRLTEDIRSIERRVCRFYDKIIKDYYDLDENFSPIYVGNRYRKKLTREMMKLFLLCIQDTCLGLRKFYASLIEYKEIAKYLSKKELISIYCVQGKSLLSALGVSIVVDEAVEKYRLTSRAGMKQIQLIVNEKDENWRSLYSYIVERVNSCYKNVEIKLELVNERSNRLSVEVIGSLKEVDIVIIARYFSQFHYLRIKTHFLEAILKRMKELSILFYLDTYHKTRQDTLRRLFSKLDSLIEIRSKKAVYKPLKNTRNKKYFLEFPFLLTTAFEDVMYSTCVKYPGISYNSSGQKDFQNEVSLLRYSRREMKVKITERFEKENSLPSSLKKMFDVNTFETETLIMLRKLLNPSMGKFNRKTKSARKNSMLNLNVTDIANFSPSKSLILTPGINRKNKATKHPKNRNLFLRPTTLSKKAYFNSKLQGVPSTEAFEASKAIEKLISVHLHHKEKYFEMKRRSNAESIRTSKCSGELVVANAHYNNKYSEVNKRKTGTTRSTEWFENLFFANLQNKNKYRCPYLSTKETVTDYAYYLAEIYYSKHFDRKKLTAPKLKSDKHLKN